MSRRFAVRVAAAAAGIVASIGCAAFGEGERARPVDSFAILAPLPRALSSSSTRFFCSPVRIRRRSSPIRPHRRLRRPKIVPRRRHDNRPRPGDVVSVRADGRRCATTATRRGAAQRSDRRTHRSSFTSSSRIAAVQRVLSRIRLRSDRPSGILDEPTSAAIEKFESDHKLPVTGGFQDRLLSELSAMIGHPIE